MATGVRQPKVRIDTNMGIHAEVPMVAAFRLVQFWVTFPTVAPSAFGAAITVASTTVPWRNMSPLAINVALAVAKT